MGSDSGLITYGKNYINTSVFLSGEEAPYKFSIDDIEIVVENPDIISVEFKELNATYLYFTVKGKIKGNTSLYLKSKDGAVISNSIKINVIGEYLMPEDPTPTPKPTPKSKKKTTKKTKKTTRKKKVNVEEVNPEAEEVKVEFDKES